MYNPMVSSLTTHFHPDPSVAKNKKQPPSRGVRTVRAVPAADTVPAVPVAETVFASASLAS
jgi:hypothetical protein